MPRGRGDVDAARRLPPTSGERRIHCSRRRRSRIGTAMVATRTPAAMGIMPFGVLNRWSTRRVGVTGWDSVSGQTSPIRPRRLVCSRCSAVRALAALRYSATFAPDPVRLLQEEPVTHWPRKIARAVLPTRMPRGSPGSPRRSETNVEPRKRLGPAPRHATWPTGSTSWSPMELRRARPGVSSSREDLCSAARADQHADDAVTLPWTRRRSL